MFIRYRSHNTADSQTVKIIINKNQNTKKNGCQLCTYTALDMNTCPSTEGSRTSRFVHHTYHNTENNQEHQNTHVIAVSQNTYDTILEYMQNRSLKLESGIENASDHNTDK